MALAMKAKRVAQGRKVAGAKKAVVPDTLSLSVRGKLLKLKATQKVRFTQENPKSRGTGCYDRYQAYRKGDTLASALRLGAKPADVAWDLARGFAKLAGPAQAQVPAAKPAKAKAGGSSAAPEARGAKRKLAARESAATGKQRRTKDGRIAIDRPYADRKAWEQRRRVEQAPPGGWPKPPAHWPPGVRVDIGRPVYWLPDGWGQGVKTTCASKLLTYISPEGKCYYHRHIVEQVHGQSLGKPRDPEALAAWARKFAKMALEEGKNWNRQVVKFDADTRLFSKLTAAERAMLPRPSEFHFAVVSARRANVEQGLRNIVNVQAQLVADGAKPVWYVDAPSLKDYQSLGLTAKVGGKLVPARNLALSDALKSKKICVQVSDDITRWDFYAGSGTGTGGGMNGLQAANQAAKKAERLHISPMAAARFLVAKMRAARKGSNGDGPRLAGVFPLGNTGQAFTRDETCSEHFILGDFFVAEGSPCKFDPRMTLKEDYDYTCTHLAKHGSVFRCNRMFIHAVHETNAGGACSLRDEQGDKERANIAVLREKWPGVFMVNGNRGDTQVIMSWKRRKF